MYLDPRRPDRETLWSYECKAITETKERIRGLTLLLDSSRGLRIAVAWGLISTRGNGLVRLEFLNLHT